MAHVPAFERDIALMQPLLADASKGIIAAEAVISQHSEPDARLTALNFPLEESLLREAVRLLQGWQSHAANLLRRLDTKTASANLQFERLFDENAGRQSQGFLRRRVHLGNAVPEAISADLVKLLSASAALDVALAQAKPLLVLHHRSCEAHLLRLESRRRQLDVALEQAGRQLELLEGRTRERQAAAPPFGGRALSAASEEERRTLALDRHAAQVADEQLRFERETLLRLIAEDEEFLAVLNRGVAAVNVMGAKLKVDIEQRVALLKAAQAQSKGATPEPPVAVQQLVQAFDANLLGGHDLLSRKQRADEAFSRRLEAVAEVDDTDEQEGGSSPAPSSPVPPVI